MTWTAVPSTDLDPESPLTTSLMNALYDNVGAMAAGDAGAPQIQAAAIDVGAVGASELAADAVHQAEIYKGDWQNSTTSSTSVQFTTSQHMCFYPRYWHSGGTSASRGNDYAVTGASALVDLTLAASGGGTAFMSLYYVLASPPYIHDNEIVPLFVFALVDKSGNVVAVSSAEDAPWHYGGPTDCKATHYAKDGTPYQYKKIITPEMAKMPPHERVAALRESSPCLVEITQEMKMADMDLCPHPFATVPDGLRVVMLDPVSPVLHDFLELRKSGDDETNALLHAGYLKLGNDSIGRQSPRSVLDVSVRWRNKARV